MVSQLTEKILTYAGECGLKTKKKRGKKRTGNSPWFDVECVKLKKEMQHLAKSLKNSPDNNFIRENIYLAKRKYQSTLKKKKNIYKHAIIEEMHSCGKGDARKFWKLLDKLSTNISKNAVPNNISMSKWTTHFKSILNSKQNVVIPSCSDNTGPLDYKFRMEELAVATAILKTGKCPGLDNVTNEMILCIFNIYPT